LAMRKRRVDYAGVASLVAGLAPLLVALSLGGHELAWTSPLLLGLLAASFVLVHLLAGGKRREEPEPAAPAS